MPPQCSGAPVYGYIFDNVDFAYLLLSLHAGSHIPQATSAPLESSNS